MFKKYVILLYERYATLVKGNIRNDSDNITTAIRSTLETNKDPEVKRAKLKPLLKKKNIHAQIKRETDQLQLSSVKKQKLNDTVKTEPEDVKVEPVDVKTEPTTAVNSRSNSVNSNDSQNAASFHTPGNTVKERRSRSLVKSRSVTRSTSHRRKGSRLKKQTARLVEGHGSKKPWIHLK